MKREKASNRIKVILAEKNLTNKWLAEKVGKDQATVSKWVTNTSQPNFESLIRIADSLGVTVDSLINS